MKTITQNKHLRPNKSLKVKAVLFCLMATALFAAMPDLPAATITNLPPVAMNDVVQRNANSHLRVRINTLLANDTDPGNGNLTFISVSATSAAGGTVIRYGKWIAYSPPPGFTNSDSFSYVISNSSGLMATGLVSIIIRSDLDASENVATREVIGNGATRLQFFGIPGHIYIIHYTESLETPHWRPLGKQLADATGKFEFTDTLPTNSAARFYRSTIP